MQLAIPGIVGLGWPELIIIVLVVLLIFGGKKLPEIARGTGRALRIFKSETKGLMDEDEKDEADKKSDDRRSEESTSPPQITSSSSVEADAPEQKASDPQRHPGT